MGTFFEGTFDDNGNSDVFKIRQPRRASDKVVVTLAAYGTFGSGTLALQFSLDGTNFTTITDGTTSAELTATGMFSHEHAPFDKEDITYRLNLSGATSPDITYKLATVG